jgi:hypothetical protein
MQFKKVGKKIQVLAYRGYDSEKRRSIVQLLGTLDAYSLEPSLGLLDNLTTEEKTELQSYKENLLLQYKKQYDSHSILSIVSRINSVSTLLETPENYTVGEEWGERVWDSIEKLQKALKKAGYAKPKREPKTKPQQDEKQSGLDLV